MSNYVLTPSAVRKLRGALAATPGNSGAAGAPSPVDIDDFPPPFTVRWSASANSGAGAWVIWLPDKAQLVMLKDAYITPTGVTAEQALPAGWYTIDDAQASSTVVYLVVTIPDAGSPSAEFSVTAGQATTGETVLNIIVAQMAADSTSGAKRVKQFVDSAVVLGGEGGGEGTVALDDVSTDWNTSNKVQVKDWDTGTPASSTTIAQDINAGNTTAQGTMVERTTGGVLQYKKPGTLAQLLGSTVALSSQKVLTGLSWNTSNHRLVISSANITVANGVITSWTANANENIETTAISSIIPQSS